jgi:hypothetical protein
MWPRNFWNHKTRHRSRHHSQCLFCTQHTVYFTVRSLVLIPYTRTVSVCVQFHTSSNSFVLSSLFRDNCVASPRHGTARRVLSCEWKTVPMNILNKQSRTADKGWSSSLGVGRGATTPHRKTLTTLQTITKDSESDWSFGTTWEMENGYEIWPMEREEPV